MVVSILQRFGLSRLRCVGEPLQSRAGQNTRTIKSGRHNHNGAAAFAEWGAFHNSEGEIASSDKGEKNPDNKMRGHAKAGAAGLLPKVNAIPKLPLRGDKQ